MTLWESALMWNSVDLFGNDYVRLKVGGFSCLAVHLKWFYEALRDEVD